jgi:prophage regulatory protein
MKIIRLKAVTDTTGLARSTIYKYIAEGRFPMQISLGGGCSGWLLSEVEDWILARIEERDVAHT